MSNDPDEKTLARDMIEMHGLEAAGIARTNARSAAVAGAVVSARNWIRVVGAIQREQRDRGQNPPYPNDISLPDRIVDRDVK